jgi:Cu(I)/Ag(I) efflux system membrane fusion protein
MFVGGSAALAALVAVGFGGYLVGARSHAPTAAAAASAVTASGGTQAPRRILYYRNPMGLADTSPTPKKDPMGMDYIPVYEGEETASAEGAGGSAGQIRISTEKIQKLGVRTETAAQRTLGRVVRATGRVEPDERRVAMIAPKFEGYVERLHVNATGQPVAQGQPLFEVYSPELVSAQREYAIAMQGQLALKDAGAEAAAGMRQLADATLARLRNWDLSAEELSALVQSGEVRRAITLRSPVAGIVTEKKAFQGMRFMPGEALYQVTDLSSVWVLADVFEQDIGIVKVGSRASVRLNAYPDQVFEGRITYVYPTLKAETRTVPVRIELANPRQMLKPAMFAQVEVQVGSGAKVLTVPDSAVIDTGKRRLVLVQRGEGRFEPREVKLGARSDNWVEVLEGLRDGEPVVVAANFLIDAESNLKAAVGGFGGHAAHGGQPAATGAPAAAGKSAASAPAAAPSSGVGHQGKGSVDSVDAKAGSVTLNHEAIASLKWPAMTMEFKVANPSLLSGLKPGTRLSFEIVERQAGEWVITKATAEPAPAGAGPAAARAASPAGAKHSGH